MKKPSKKSVAVELAEIEGSPKEEAAETPEEEASEMDGMSFSKVKKTLGVHNVPTHEMSDSVKKIHKYNVRSK